jgi:phosphoribosylglycinamide formyltransferase-1
MKNIAVFISGRGSNFKAINETIKNGFIKNTKIAIVVCDNDEANGLIYAKDNNIPYEIINNTEKKVRETKILNILTKNNIALLCLAGYMKIIGKAIIERYTNKIMNIHPSLLPSFPGLNAQKQALDYGVKITGCTLHFVDALVDHGPIILQRAVEIDKNDDVDSLFKKILQREHEIYSLGVKLFVEDRLYISDRKVFIK